MNILNIYKTSIKSLFSILLFVLLVGFNGLSAQVTTLNAWTNQFHGTSQAQQTIAYPVPGGSNTSRMLVVAIAADRTVIGAMTVTLTYGGQTLTPLAGDMSLTTARQHTQLYYLNESGLKAATNTNLIFTISGGTTRIADLWTAVFDYVNQLTPFSDSRNYSSLDVNTTTATLSPALTINTNDLAIEVVSSVRVGNTTARTFTYSTNWTLANQQTSTATDGIRNAVVNRSIPVSNITDAATITFSGNARGSLTGASLNYYRPKYFRSNAATGSWNTLATWQESFDGSTGWATATSLPTVNDVQVTIQAGHTITSSAVNVSPSLIVTGNLNVTANTLTPSSASINGTTTISGTGSFVKGTGTIQFNSGSSYVHNRDGGDLPIATWNSNSTCSITGVIATLPTASTFIQTFGNFIWNCPTQTADLSLSGAISGISGNFTMQNTNSGSVRLFNGGGSYALNISGNYSQTGGTFYVFGTGTGTGFTGILNVLGDFSISNGTLDISGTDGTSTLNVAKNFTFSNGTITESGTGTANLNFNGTTTQTYLKSGGTFSNTINFGVGSSSIVDFGTSVIDGSNGTFNLLGSGTVLTKNLDGFALTGATGTIQVSGTRNYSTSANYEYNGTLAQVTGTGLVTANNLTINNTAGVSLSSSTTVNNLLSFTNGRLTLGANNLIFGANALAVGGTLNASNMIVAASTGQVRKLFTANGAYTLPLGDIVGTAEYSPITITFASGTYAGGAYVTANVTNTKHPNNTSTTNFINRYWTVSSSGITSFSASVDAKYLDADLIGLPANQFAARFATSTWTTYGILSANSLIATSLTGFGDFTSIANPPVINATPTSLTTFSYQQGAGPSNILNFTVTGTRLIDNVIVYPTTNFEVSELGGVSFVARSLVTLYASGDAVNQDVYVRMKAGLSQGAIGSENVTFTTTGAPAVVNVACSGTVTAQPTITVFTTPTTTPVNLSGFSATFKGTASAIQSFTVSGANLMSDISLTAPTGYEIKTSAQTTYVTSLTLTPAGATLANTTINVRLKSGNGVGSYNENIVATASYADSKTVALYGVVNPVATITTSTSWLAGFIYALGNVNPSSQTFYVNGTTLSADIALSVPTGPQHFQLSTNGTNWSNTVTLPRSGNSVTNAIVYARLNPGLSVGSYGPTNVTITSSGAVVKTVALSGQVVNSPTILVSRPTLSGFGYLFGSGPSVSQSVTISGDVLSADIVVAPPLNFEIYNPTTEQYQSTPLTLPRNGATVAPTEVLVRLKAGLEALNFSESLTVNSSPATEKTVALTGKVFATPLITTTGGGNYCLGETINLTSTGIDVQSRFWTGPGNFYSILNNPTLTNATEAMSGAYTVTGNVIVGGNLIYNGDFESGNTGVGSSYTYVVPGKSLNTNGNLWPESTYTVDTNPQASHNNFPVCPPGPGDPTGNRMIINGAPQAGVVIWSQSVSVIPNSNYEFVYFLQSVRPEAPSQLQLYVNGEMAGPIYSASSTTCIWNKYIYNTNSGSNNLLNLELINMNTVANGNDFALDDISFKQILSATSTQNVVVSPSVVASVTVTHSPTSVYQNTPVVFTANPVNGGATPTYKWFVGGVEQVGQTASTLNYTPTATGALTVTCQMTSSITCASPKPAIGTDNITVQAPIQNYWMGYIDTDWGKPANWTANYIPATGDNVIYATVANFGTAAMRDLQLDINRTIGSLINATIRRLIIPANLTLNCNNVITVTPPVTVPVTNAEDLVYIKASTTLPNGSIIYRNTQSLPAYGTVEMYSPASWDLSRPINQKYNWQFFGIPVTAVDALPTFYGAYVRELIESDNDTSTHWRMLTNTSVLVPFKGYELCQKNANTLYTFKGQLVNSNFESGQFVKTTTGNPLYPGQHLFANPYTAALDINLIDFGNGVEKTAYLYATGTFVQWRTNKLKTDGAIPGQYFAVPRGQAGEFGIPRQVPSMGTLMVRVPKANATTELSYVNFAYNTVAMGNLERQRVKAATIADNQTTTVIDVEGENAADRMWLMSNEGFTRGFDNGFDGIKLKGSALNPQLYAVEKDGEYQVNSVDDLNNTTLAFQVGQDTEYKIKFTHNDNTALKYNKILLHDLIENRIVDITSSGTEYTFNATSASSAVLRFKIITQTNNNETMKLNVSKAYYFNNQLYVQNFSNISGKVYVYDISGRTVAIKSISANENIQIATPKSNVYIVKIAIGESTETVKLFLK
jgi:hypothetical protein